MFSCSINVLQFRFFQMRTCSHRCIACRHSVEQHQAWITCRLCVKPLIQIRLLAFVLLFQLALDALVLHVLNFHLLLGHLADLASRSTAGRSSTLNLSVSVLLRLQILQVFVIENDSLNFIFAQQGWEDRLPLRLVLQISSHVVLQGQKVKHLMEHCHRLAAHLLVALLLSVNFHRFETFTEFSDFAVNRSKFRSEIFFE